MTPLQLAKNECANYESDGSCSGISIRDDLSLAPPKKNTVCVLSGGMPCKYFEECVMDRKREGMAEVRSEYERLTGQLFSDQLRPCPDCGATMSCGKRLCDACRKKRRKSSTRRSVSKMRQACKQLSQKSIENAQ